jgi:protein tyrosine phosphatase
MTPDSKEWPDAERRHWELYWSELTMVEDHQVEGAMVRFRDALKAYIAMFKAAAGKEFDKTELNSATLQLAKTLRKSLEEQWTDTSLTSH